MHYSNCFSFSLSLMGQKLVVQTFVGERGKKKLVQLIVAGFYG